MGRELRGVKGKDAIKAFIFEKIPPNAHARRIPSNYENRCWFGLYHLFSLLTLCALPYAPCYVLTKTARTSKKHLKPKTKRSALDT